MYYIYVDGCCMHVHVDMMIVEGEQQGVDRARDRDCHIV